MKRTILVVAIALMASVTSFAQTVVKVGYTNVDYVISKLPESKQVKQQLKEHEDQLAKQLQSKQKTFQLKLQEYQKGAQTMIQAVRQDKERELQTLQQQAQEFQVRAQESIQKKYQELMQPVFDKVQKAIEAVAKKEGFSHIFSTDAAGAPVILYASENTNISDMVLKHLGVTVEKKAAK
ncbi:MAG: OmpH family outer membrane protein [Cytophagales bacterium]|nr:OmpH family outer membrane protein [Cytophagales bacterium]